MFDNQHLLRQLVILVVLVIMGGTVGYTLVEEGWTLFDGFYMTLITLTTIGFSEVHTMSTPGRVLTVMIIIFGLGSAATILTQLGHLMMQGNILAIWRKRRMGTKISKMKSHVIICGYGRIGQAICRDLTNMGVQCVIVDRDDSRVDGAQLMEIPVLSGNATTDEALIEAGVERATILVAALSNDSDNLFVALAARDLNPNLMVIARGEDKSIETRMLRAGVDRVVYPAQLGGGQIARLVGAELGKDDEADNRRRITDVMGYELQVYRNFSKGGTTISEIRNKSGALRIVAHIDDEGVRHQDPEGKHKVAEGDAVVMVVNVVAAPGVTEKHGHDFDMPKNLGVGIPAIDEEHRHILLMIHRLKASEDKSGDVAGDVLGDLREYTVKHFKHEESLLESLGYPDLEAHIGEHRALTRKVDQLIGDSGIMHRENVRNLLEAWVKHHILDSDQRYVQFMSEKTTVETIPVGVGE